MSVIPFRFLQTGDFRLGVPPSVPGELPSTLVDALLDAPYRAVEQVVDTALSENVSFVALVGEVIDWRQGSARALAFFLEQIDRLAARDIEVYWAGKESADWPEAIPLPENVHRFADRAIEAVRHHDGEGPALATILGSTKRDRPLRPTDYRGSDGLPTIALANGTADAKALSHQPISYWALGGEPVARTLFQTKQTAHYAGSPQGHNANEAAAHGCTLVDIDQEGIAHLQQVSTDLIRWRSEEIELPLGSTQVDLERDLVEKGSRMLDSTSARHWIVSWSVRCSTTLARRLRNPVLVDELIERMHRMLGRDDPSLWVLNIEPVDSFSPTESSFEEESILGEYLRTIREVQEDPDEVHYLADTIHRAEAEPALAEIITGAIQEEELCEAAALGVRLLSGNNQENSR